MTTNHTISSISTNIEDHSPTHLHNATTACQQITQLLFQHKSVMVLRLRMDTPNNLTTEVLPAQLNHHYSQMETAMKEADNHQKNYIDNFFCDQPNAYHDILRSCEELHDLIDGILSECGLEPMLVNKGLDSTKSDTHNELVKVLNTILLQASEGKEICRNIITKLDEIKNNPEYLRMIFNDFVSRTRSFYEVLLSYSGFNNMKKEPCKLASANPTDKELKECYKSMTTDEGRKYVINLLIDEASHHKKYNEVLQYVPQGKRKDVVLVLDNWGDVKNPIRCKSDYRFFCNWAEATEIKAFLEAIHAASPGIEIPSKSSLRSQKDTKKTDQFSKDMDLWVAKLRTAEARKQQKQ